MRTKLGIAKTDFIVFFAFDYQSSFERKNPLGAVEAFKIFAAKHPDAVFIMKTNNLERYVGVVLL